ncbi:unnamed protein product [Chrysoparadoxa australica]
MAGGPLRQYLVGENCPLTWDQRINIVAKVVEGLSFLHSATGSKTALVHGNLKPDNVLLSGDLRSVRLSDFGYTPAPASQQMMQDTANNHLDPTVRRTGVFTPESDVYSLSVIMLELLTGKLSAANEGIVTKVRVMIHEGRLGECGDATEGWNAGALSTFAKLARKGTAKNQSQRPTLARIAKELALIQVAQG